ncbi:hypothetical protein H0H92_007031 [Tricholoma furcatifolium]|nr:hypothetical protein H0H92_007031 [Tricholoma furcatifolium]
MPSAFRRQSPIVKSSPATAKDSSLIAPTLSSFFSDYLLDFQTTAQSLTSTLYGELEAIFSRLDIHDISPPHKSSHTTSTSTKPKPHPSYIEPAYQWLLANIHNPYPSKEIRAKIARKANSDTKNVEAWFVDARSRIGWNKLRKAHFGNRRADIVEAATSFFVKLDEKRPLGSSLEFQFAQMEIAAKTLYSEKFEETALAARLDVAVKDLTPEMKIQAQEVAQRRRKAASLYPSPVQSPEPAGFQSLENNENVATSSPDAATRRKRRCSSSETDTDDAIQNQPAKRARVESLSSATPCLPSPAPSAHQTLRQSASPRVEPQTPTASRKRRLSDADDQSAPKRPCNVPVGPRSQSVSDPLPLASDALFDDSDLENWFKTHFGNADIVNVAPLEGWDLSIHTYSAPDATTSLTPRDSIPGLSSSPEPDNGLSILVGEDTISHALEINPNTFDYNELFDNFEEPIFPTAVQPSLADFNFLANLPAVSDPAHVITNVVPPALDHLTMWPPFPSFEQVGEPLTAINPLHTYNYNRVLDPYLTFSEPVPHPGLNAPLPPLSDSEREKEEIKLRLAVMKEEMRRLEERIAAS